MPACLRHPYKRAAGRPTGECYVEKLAVLSKARGKGVGGQLLKWADATAASRGAEWLTLTVIKGNRAKRLYERHGLRDESTDPCECACGTCIVGALMGCPYPPELPTPIEMAKHLPTSLPTPLPSAAAQPLAPVASAIVRD